MNQCPICGWWYQGMHHVCGSALPSNIQTPITYQVIYQPCQCGVIPVLERIAVALEKLAKEEKA